jgi:hypothetical protein
MPEELMPEDLSMPSEKTPEANVFPNQYIKTPWLRLIINQQNSKYETGSEKCAHEVQEINI